MRTSNNSFRHYIGLARSGFDGDSLGCEASFGVALVSLYQLIITRGVIRGIALFLFVGQGLRRVEYWIALVEAVKTRQALCPYDIASCV